MVGSRGWSPESGVQSPGVVESGIRGPMSWVHRIFKFKLENANCKFQICILQSTISNLQFEGKVVLVVFEIRILDLNRG